MHGGSRTKLGIVGGALQGIEATYLSRKARFETVVLDRRENAPARSLADSSVTLDVVKEPEKAAKILADCDAVLPALENLDALETLDRMKGSFGGPFLFDLRAYDISCSKQRSNEMMAKLGVPLPQPYPECGFPAIVKPSCQSGSVGVSEVNSAAELPAALKKVADLHDEPIIQEFVHGKSISVEAVGNGRKARSYVTTEVVLDYNYDCKQVLCQPDILPPAEDKVFGSYLQETAETIGLSGIMDLEGIYGPRGLRILEIDARLPSQTPAAVVAATGVNLLDELYRAVSGQPSIAVRQPGCSSYEHFYSDGNRLIASGEKEFSHVQQPRYYEGLFGSDEMMTDYLPGRSRWHATVITHGKTPGEVLTKRKKVIAQIMRECGLEEFVDRMPEVV
ncbi:MAG: 3-methylornithine--L-lysine ligase PylC [Methanomethylophilus sp.]